MLMVGVDLACCVGVPLRVFEPHTTTGEGGCVYLRDGGGGSSVPMFCVGVSLYACVPPMPIREGGCVDHRNAGGFPLNQSANGSLPPVAPVDVHRILHRDQGLFF